MGLFRTAGPAGRGEKLPPIDLELGVSTQLQRVLIIRAAQTHFKAGAVYFWSVVSILS